MMNIEFKILTSNVNTPDITDLTAMYRIKYLPKNKRRFESISKFRKYIKEPSNSDDIFKCPNNIRYLNSDIVQNYEFTFDGTISTHSYINKKGLIFDGGTLPLRLQSIVRNPSRLGYTDHDENYKYKTVFETLIKAREDFRQYANSSVNNKSKLIADKYMKANHIYRNVPWLRRQIAYWSVRFFGTSSYNKHRLYD